MVNSKHSSSKIVANKMFPKLPSIGGRDLSNKVIISPEVLNEFTNLPSSRQSIVLDTQNPEEITIKRPMKKVAKKAKTKTSSVNRMEKINNQKLKKFTNLYLNGLRPNLINIKGEVSAKLVEA